MCKGDNARVDFIEFMLWKAAALMALAFFAGLFGFIGPEAKAGREKRPE
jgi:hypothetical protein